MTTDQAIEAAARAIASSWFGNGVDEYAVAEVRPDAEAALRAAAPILMEQGARLALEAIRWQPIDTAPEDGDMLVRNGDVVAVAFRDSGMSSYRFFSPATQRDLDFGPTEWMPIPDAAALDPAEIVKGSGRE